MTTTTKFSKRENIKMLWDILLGELGINNANKSIVTNIQYIFEQNISPFIQENNKGVKKKTLMDLNKEFLGQVVFAVYKLFPNLKKGAKQITILEDVLEPLDYKAESQSEQAPYRAEPQVPYMAEDIQASRKTASEKEFEKKRLEFENYMFVKKPDEPIFSYGDKADERIKEMDALVSEKMAERNIDPFFSKSNLVDAESWLKPIETKETKGLTREIGTKEQDIPTPLKGGRLRHINIDDNNNITLNIKEQDQPPNGKSQDQPIGKKRVSWNETLSSFASEGQIEGENIADGKKIDNKYISQLSQPLPEIIQQLPPQQVHNKINIPNPIIPMNELIKQNNEMNTKIENLYELIFKLTNMVQELTDKQQHSCEI